jgi:uncharacterized membrane protein
MSKRLGLISRIALFSALVYVLSWGTAFLPNVNLMFFIVFSAGFLWGAIPGALVGLIGMGLWSGLNPFGPALLPIMMAQMLGAAACGPVGTIFAKSTDTEKASRKQTLLLGLASIICTTLYYLPVNFVDAWTFGPFWPRFWANWGWTAPSLVSNLIVFPIMFTAVRLVYRHERLVAP